MQASTNSSNVGRGSRPSPRTVAEGGRTPSLGPVRTCVGCGARAHASREEAAEGEPLLRFVIGPNGQVAVDAAGGAFGRGVHLHARPACFGRAVQGLLRATKGQAKRVADELLDEAALGREVARVSGARALALLSAAARARKLAVGSDAVREACAKGDAALLVVACDAAAAAELTEVRDAVRDGRAVAFGDKTTLAFVAGKLRERSDGRPNEVGVVAVIDAKLGAAISRAVHAHDIGAAAVASAGARAVKKRDSAERAKKAEPAGEELPSGERSA